ncbi:hypothetical protein [Halosimplex amylolyticum]|uniref:hypothetical protein n=1 Tax=Halosimplex amylolyticum TaxID=3396616 RepID=UPI003F563DE0
MDFCPGEGNYARIQRPSRDDLRRGVTVEVVREVKPASGVTGRVQAIAPEP